MLDTVNSTVTKITYGRREAAMALGISLVTLDKFIHRANDPLPTFKAGSHKVLIPIDALKAWLERETERNTKGRG